MLFFYHDKSWKVYNDFLQGIRDETMPGSRRDGMRNPTETAVKKDDILDPTLTDIKGTPWANGTWNLPIAQAGLDR